MALNTYNAFWRGQQKVRIYAETSYKAQIIAQRQFGRKCTKPWEIAIVLVELADGTPVVHTGAEF